jgi:Tol biopolymer transport system component
MPIVFSLILAVIGISVISVIAFGTNSPEDSENIFSGMPQYLSFISDRPGGVGGFDIYLFDLHNQKFVPLPGLNSKEDEDRPALSKNSENIAFSVRHGGATERITLHLYDRNQKRHFEFPRPSTEYFQTNPSLSLDGRWVAFAYFYTNDRGLLDHNIALYDRQHKQRVPFDNLNSKVDFESYPNISPDGRYLAFQRFYRAEKSETDEWRNDIYLYDIEKRDFVDLPNLNSDMNDEYPSLSANTEWIAFSSDRGGKGSDIHLYNRYKGNFDKLPNLNTSDYELQPSISSDGRWIAYVLLRANGPSDYDIRIYDRKKEVVIDLDSVNSTADDIFPVFSR